MATPGLALLATHPCKGLQLDAVVITGIAEGSFFQADNIFVLRCFELMHRPKDELPVDFCSKNLFIQRVLKQPCDEPI